MVYIYHDVSKGDVETPRFKKVRQSSPNPPKKKRIYPQVVSRWEQTLPANHLRCWAALASHFFRLIESDFENPFPPWTKKVRKISHFHKHFLYFQNLPFQEQPLFQCLVGVFLIKPKHHLWGDLQHTTRSRCFVLTWFFLQKNLGQNQPPKPWK